MAAINQLGKNGGPVRADLCLTVTAAVEEVWFLSWLGYCCLLFNLLTGTSLGLSITCPTCMWVLAWHPGFWDLTPVRYVLILAGGHL